MIAQFNRVSSWVVTQICTTITLEERVRKLEKLISLCDELFQLQNYNGTMEILSGLNNSAVRRMKATWEGLSKETEAKFQAIETTMSHEHSYKTYRGLLHNLNPPCVPYLGMYLTDMVFIEEGNKDKIDGALINFQKRTKLGEVITEVKQYQIDYRRRIYGQKKHIAEFLLSLPSLPDNDCYLFSVRVEPKDLNYEKVIEKGIQDEETLVRKLRGLKITCRQLERRLAELRGEAPPPELTDATVDDLVPSSASTLSLSASISIHANPSPTHDLSSSSSDALLSSSQSFSSSPPPRPPKSPAIPPPRSPIPPPMTIPLPFCPAGSSTPEFETAPLEGQPEKAVPSSKHSLLHRNYSSIEPGTSLDISLGSGGSVGGEEEGEKTAMARDRSGSISRKLRKLEKKDHEKKDHEKKDHEKKDHERKEHEKKDEKKEDRKEREMKMRKKSLRTNDKRKSAMGVIWTPSMWGSGQDKKPSES